MNLQEQVYAETEANSFFRRNFSQINLEPSGLRKEKEDIYQNIVDHYEYRLSSLHVLEIGCCIGDLINKFRNDFSCNVVGIEPSSLACEYALSKFNLPLINDVYNQTEYFGFHPSSCLAFDIVIVDDVLSWMSREIILPALASIDWLVKPRGCIYLRDFCPPVDFAYPNHHQLGKNVYNYKVAGGHKKFFLNSGNYFLRQEFVRADSQYQKITTSRPDFMIWSDAIIVKHELPLYPRLEM